MPARQVAIQRHAQRRQVFADDLLQAVVHAAPWAVGDKVIAAMKRQAKAGEFRSNLHRGGSASLIKITPEERMTAVRAARVMGLNVAGVDILRSNHGPLVMEVNSSPGLEGIETTTGKDVAGMIIQYLEKNAEPGQTRTKGRG